MTAQNISFYRFFSAIERADVPSETLVALLDSKKDACSKLLGFFKSETPKAKPDQSNASNRSHRDLFLEKISVILMIPITDSENFLKSYRSDHPDKPEVLDDTLLDEIMVFYFEERASLLHSVSALLRCANDSDHPYYEQAERFVKQLVDMKLSETALRVLENIFAAVRGVPVDILSEKYASRWVAQYVLECLAVAEVIFLLYYASTPTSAKDALVSAEKFQALSFGAKLEATAALPLDEASRATMARFGFLCALIVIEQMDLEAVLEEDARSVHAHKVLSDVEGTSKLDEVLQTYGLSPHESPCLFAWSALMAQGSRLHYPSCTKLEYRQHASKAMSTGVLPYLLSNLKDLDVSADLDVQPNAVAYRSVVRGLLSAVVASFEISFLPQYDLFVDLACLLYNNEPALCLQFWEQDYPSEALRSLLDACSERFPHEFSPLIRLLSSLIGDPDSASHVFHLLLNLQSFACSTSTDIVSKGYNGPYAYSVSTPGGITAGPVIIPTGTSGKELALPDKPDKRVFEWKVSYSAWQLFNSALERFIDRPHMSVQPDIAAILSLIYNLCRFNPDLVEYIIDFFQESSSSSLPIQLRQYSDGQPLGLVGVVLATCYRTCSLPEPSQSLLSAGFSCLTLLVQLTPDHFVWAALHVQLLPTFTTSQASTTSSRMDSIAGVVQRIESSVGSYPTILRILELADVLIDETVQTCKPGLELEFSKSLLNYVTVDWFSSHQMWPYSRLLHKYQIASQVLRLHWKLLQGCGPNPELEKTPELLSRRLDVLLLKIYFVDSMVQQALVTSIASAEAGMRRLVLRRRVQSGRLLDAAEDVLIHGLRVLNCLLRFAIAHKDVQPASLYSALLQEIHWTNTSIIAIIASFVGYPNSKVVQEQAVLCLSLLCQSLTTLPITTPLLPLLGTKAEQLRSHLSHMLSSSDEDELVRCRIIQLLIESVRSQSGLAEFLLRVPKRKRVRFVNEPPPAAPPPDTDTDSDAADDSCFGALLVLLHDSENLLQRSPRVLSRALELVNVIWAASATNGALPSSLRANPSFFADITSPLFSDSDPDADRLLSPAPGQPEDDADLPVATVVFPLEVIDGTCHRLLAQSFAFRLASVELHLGLGNRVKEQFLQRVVSEKRLDMWMQHSLRLIPSKLIASAMARLKACAADLSLPVPLSSFHVSPAVELMEGGLTGSRHFDIHLMTTLLPHETYGSQGIELIQAASELNILSSLAHSRIQLVRSLSDLLSIFSQASEPVRPALTPTPSHLLLLAKLLEQSESGAVPGYPALGTAQRQVALALSLLVNNHHPLKPSQAQPTPTTGTSTDKDPPSLAQSFSSALFTCLRRGLNQASTTQIQISLLAPTLHAALALLSPLPTSPSLSSKITPDDQLQYLNITCSCIQPRGDDQSRDVTIAAVSLLHVLLAAGWPTTTTTTEGRKKGPSQGDRRDLSPVLTCLEATGALRTLLSLLEHAADHLKDQATTPSAESDDTWAFEASHVLDFLSSLASRDQSRDWLLRHGMTRSLARLADSLRGGSERMPPPPYTSSNPAERTRSHRLWCKLLDLWSLLVSARERSGEPSSGPSSPDLQPMLEQSLLWAWRNCHSLVAGLTAPCPPQQTQSRTTTTTTSSSSDPSQALVPLTSVPKVGAGPGLPYGSLTLAALEEAEAGTRLLVSLVAERYRLVQASLPGLCEKATHAICAAMQGLVQSRRLGSATLQETLLKITKEESENPTFTSDCELHALSSLVNCLHFLRLITPNFFSLVSLSGLGPVVSPHDLPLGPEVKYQSLIDAQPRTQTPLALLILALKQTLSLCARYSDGTHRAGIASSPLRTFSLSLGGPPTPSKQSLPSSLPTTSQVSTPTLGPVSTPTSYPPELKEIPGRAFEEGLLVLALHLVWYVRALSSEGVLATERVTAWRAEVLEEVGMVLGRKDRASRCSGVLESEYCKQMDSFLKRLFA